MAFLNWLDVESRSRFQTPGWARTLSTSPVLQIGPPDTVPVSPLPSRFTLLRLSAISKFPKWLKWTVWSLCTYRQAPVDMGHPDVQVETEDEQEDRRHDEGAAADKLEKVDASTGRTHHDGLYADEADKC